MSDEPKPHADAGMTLLDEVYAFAGWVELRIKAGLDERDLILSANVLDDLVRYMRGLIK